MHLRFMLLMQCSSKSVFKNEMIWEPLFFFNEVNVTGRSNVSAETLYLVKVMWFFLCRPALLCLVRIGRNSHILTHFSIQVYIF